MAIDKTRFQRLPGAAKRYLDLQTGEEISYRRAITLSTGMSPEELATLRKEVGRHTPSRTRELEQQVSRLGVKVRGKGSEKWREVKQKLNASKSLRSKDPRGGNWISILEEEYDTDFVNRLDWDRVFYPERAK